MPRLVPPLRLIEGARPVRSVQPPSGLAGLRVKTGARVVDKITSSKYRRFRISSGLVVT